MSCGEDAEHKPAVGSRRVKGLCETAQPYAQCFEVMPGDMSHQVYPAETVHLVYQDQVEFLLPCVL
jgi:hypothetical protein